MESPHCLTEVLQKNNLKVKIMAVFIQLFFFFARDVDHKTCKMHTHTHAQAFMH